MPPDESGRTLNQSGRKTDDRMGVEGWRQKRFAANEHGGLLIGVAEFRWREPGMVTPAGTRFAAEQHEIMFCRYGKKLLQFFRLRQAEQGCIAKHYVKNFVG